jgi:hypothetical protein
LSTSPPPPPPPPSVSQSQGPAWKHRTFKFIAQGPAPWTAAGISSIHTGGGVHDVILKRLVHHSSMTLYTAAYTLYFRIPSAMQGINHLIKYIHAERTIKNPSAWYMYMYKHLQYQSRSNITHPHVYETAISSADYIDIVEILRHWWSCLNDVRGRPPPLRLCAAVFTFPKSIEFRILYGLEYIFALIYLNSIVDG